MNLSSMSIFEKSGGHSKAQFHDLTSDILKHIMGEVPIMKLRSISNSLKYRIDNLPDLVIHVSRAGSKDITSGFFSYFTGKLKIKCRHGWNLRSGWFRSTMTATELGICVESISTLQIDSFSLPLLTSQIKSSSRERISHIKLNLSTSTIGFENSKSAISDLLEVVKTVEIHLDLYYQTRTQEVLHTCSLLSDLPPSCSISELSLRYTLLLKPLATPNLTAQRALHPGTRIGWSKTSGWRGTSS